MKYCLLAGVLAFSMFSMGAVAGTEYPSDLSQYRAKMAEKHQLQKAGDDILEKKQKLSIQSILEEHLPIYRIEKPQAPEILEFLETYPDLNDEEESAILLSLGDAFATRLNENLKGILADVVALKDKTSFSFLISVRNRVVELIQFAGEDTSLSIVAQLNHLMNQVKLKELIASIQHTQEHQDFCKLINHFNNLIAFHQTHLTLTEVERREIASLIIEGLIPAAYTLKLNFHDPEFNLERQKSNIVDTLNQLGELFGIHLDFTPEDMEIQNDTTNDWDYALTFDGAP